MVGGTFKRPAGAGPLMGMNIGSKNYGDAAYQAQLARLDVVILGFYPGWMGDTDGSVIRRAVQQLKARNPALKVGQYTILNEAQDDPARTASDDKIVKLDQMGWWLRTADGRQDARGPPSFNAYDINISEWSRADANGDRYPQWLAKRDHALFFKRVPEFDLWYFDNVMKQLARQAGQLAHGRRQRQRQRPDDRQRVPARAGCPLEHRGAAGAGGAADRQRRQRHVVSRVPRQAAGGVPRGHRWASRGRSRPGPAGTR